MGDAGRHRQRSLLVDLEEVQVEEPLGHVAGFVGGRGFGAARGEGRREREGAEAAHR